MLGFEDTRPLNLVIPLKQAKAIGKHLDIHTCGELLRYYPRRYLHYGTGADLAGVKPGDTLNVIGTVVGTCLLYTSPSPRDRQKSRMPSSA